MPDQNVDVVERFFQAQGDLDTFLAFVDPDAEFDLSDLDRPYRGFYRGLEQIETLYHAMSDPWKETRYEIEESLGVGDRVVATVRTTRSRSGLEVQASGTVVITMDEGKIVCFKTFQSKADALAAVGLEG
jgi:ketosteroid isomerase-like protein